jgi:predicted component of type VI protein secretion system
MTGVEKVATASKSETDDAYEHVVAAFGMVRVIEADIQWIIQERRSATRWINRSFCRTSEALNRLLHRSYGLPSLSGLPSLFPENSKEIDQGEFYRAYRPRAESRNNA